MRGYLQYASFDIPLFFRLWGVRNPRALIVEPPPTTGVIVRISARLRGIPYVYFAADVSSSAAAGIGVNPVIVRVLRAVESWVLRGAALVLAVSDGVRDEVQTLGVRPNQVAVVGTGIDTATFALDGALPDCDAPYFAYAGTMSEIQGAGVFLDAFAVVAAEHPSARLVLLGGGTELDALQRRAQESGFGERIDFLGSRPGAEAARWLRGAVAGLASVRPGRGYDFAFATKTFASISTGTPVVYAGVGPAAALVREHRLGWATDWAADEVADAMRAALAGAAASRDADERARLSNWVRDNYSLTAVAANAVRAVRGVLPA
ncbi:glycosyltransferase [Microterricola viridarii]|uniref:Glycosyltransferase n=1 Tax=Microterricola viridarii TaxID=412690 RepID=A0A0Y0Q2B6_9MICO|nr:glycosyltransferase [Microterricola viridarii]